MEPETEEELIEATAVHKEGEKLSPMEISSNEETKQPSKFTVASKYETQSESELLALYGHSPAPGNTTDGRDESTSKGSHGETSETPQIIKITGRMKRKERRLRNEPQNVLGGEEGPAGVHVLDFAEARAAEICSLSKAMESKGGSKRLFQRLPRHMRRRAMSHNVKRLPRSMRGAATKEMEKTKGSGDGTVNKKKGSRKQRRNKAALQSIYAQRERKNKWLETHMWHAKRMKMCDKYGYRLAEHCSDKGVRAAYMSVAHGCLLSDISYYCCIEVSGIQGQVIASLGPMFSTDTGLTIGGKAYLQGQREGKAIVYRRGQYPLGAIGPVQFLWQSQPPRPRGTSQSDMEKDRAHLAQCQPISLWIWCHPAMHEDVLTEINALVSSFNAKNATCLKRPIPSPSEEEVPLLVSVRDLKSELVRFRLIGPRSHALLMEALKPAFEFKTDIEPNGHESGSMDVDPPNVPDVPQWWQNGSQCDLHLYRHAELLSESFDFLKTATTPAQFTKGAVVGMTVMDPRLFTPSKKKDLVSCHYPPKKNGFVASSKVENIDKEEDENSEADEIESDIEMSPASSSPTFNLELGTVNGAVIEQPVGVSSLLIGLAYSPIWNPYIRAIVSNSKVSTHIINDQRSQQFLRSSELNLGTKASKIPVLLIQQMLSNPSSSVSGHRERAFEAVPQIGGYGWDIVLPTNWGKEFWTSLVYHGARACGIEELKKCSLEVLTPYFPNDFPDTPAWQLHHDDEKVALEEKFRRFPPDKRRNYGKLLISSPFSFPWNEIISTWKQESRISRVCCLPLSAKRIKLDEESPPQQEQQQEAVFSIDSLMEESRARKRTLDSHLMSTGLVAPPTLVSILSPSVYVLRSKEILCSLAQLIEHLFNYKRQQSKLSPAAPSTPSQVAYQHSLFRSAVHEFSINNHLQNHSSALIGVKIQMYQRGNLTERDMISMPTISDFNPLLSCTKSRPHSGPKEELHPKGLTMDEGHTIAIGISSLTRKEIKEIKEERKQKQKLLKTNKGKEVTKNSPQDVATVPTLDASTSSATIDFKLLPVRPSRETFGYVTSAGYRHSTSLYSGVGFCTFVGFLEMLSRCYLAPGVVEPLALVRSASTQYWFVRLALF